MNTVEDGPMSVSGRGKVPSNSQILSQSPFEERRQGPILLSQVMESFQRLLGVPKYTEVLDPSE